MPKSLLKSLLKSLKAVNRGKMSKILIFDNDGVLRDESKSYERCVIETVEFFSGTPATKEEIMTSRQASNNDYERALHILIDRRIFSPDQKEKILESKIIPRFQELYLGKNVDGMYSGYINNEPWLADNYLLSMLKENNSMAIVSGAPKEEIVYTLKKNNAYEMFDLILGMYDCDGKQDGIKKTMNYFKSNSAYFCDDRPSPIKAALEISNISAYGILPPQAEAGWDKILRDAGAEKVFKNVKDYCAFLLQQ